MKRSLSKLVLNGISDAMQQIQESMDNEIAEFKVSVQRFYDGRFDNVIVVPYYKGDDGYLHANEARVAAVTERGDVILGV
jgi:hypothetical protein